MRKLRRRFLFIISMFAIIVWIGAIQQLLTGSGVVWVWAFLVLLYSILPVLGYFSMRGAKVPDGLSRFEETI